MDRIRRGSGSLGAEGEAGSPVTVVSLPARGRPPQAAARRAGLEFVEKLLTTAMVALLDGRNASMLRPRPAVASLVELATGPGCASSWSSSPLPRSSPAKLVGCDLD
jgi:hypothetical protein